MAHVLAKDCGLANKSWAVFDVHHYFSWDNGNGIDNCATDQNLTGYVVSCGVMLLLLLLPN